LNDIRQEQEQAQTINQQGTPNRQQYTQTYLISEKSARTHPERY